jgi:hypothetical protein
MVAPGDIFTEETLPKNNNNNKDKDHANLSAMAISEKTEQINEHELKRKSADLAVLKKVKSNALSSNESH